MKSDFLSHLNITFVHDRLEYISCIDRVVGA